MARLMRAPSAATGAVGAVLGILILAGSPAGALARATTSPALRDPAQGDTAGVSPEQAVAHLNAQRRANGIPGDLAFSDSMSEACAKHNNYIALNGGTLTHEEDPANPGYTPEGARTTPGSGTSEVLSHQRLWDDSWLSPWSNAPLHQLGMFRPDATSSGYAEGTHSTCMRFDGWAALAPAVFTYPGNGVTGVPVDTDSTGEMPYSPNQVTGVPETQAGFNILLWRYGGSYDISAASLTGPSGPVAVRIADSRTAVPGGTWRVPGAVIVPTHHLEPDAEHALDVTFTDGARHQMTFRTRRLDPVDPALRITDAFTASDGSFGLHASSRASVRAWATGPTGTMALTASEVQSHPGTEADPHAWAEYEVTATGAAAGSWTLCVASGGPGTPYLERSECQQLDVPPAQSAPPAPVASPPPAPAPVASTPATPAPAASTPTISAPVASTPAAPAPVESTPAASPPAPPKAVKATATVSARADAARNRIRVDVDPDKARSYWKVRLQRKTANGSWAWFGKAKRTKGKHDQYTFNPRGGTYRVVVAAKHGYDSGTSPEVRLKK